MVGFVCVVFSRAAVSVALLVTPFLCVAPWAIATISLGGLLRWRWAFLKVPEMLGPHLCPNLTSKKVRTVLTVDLAFVHTLHAGGYRRRGPCARRENAGEAVGADCVLIATFLSDTACSCC